MPAKPVNCGWHQTLSPVPGPDNDALREQPIPSRGRAHGAALLPALEWLGRTEALPRLRARATALTATSASTEPG